jgi:hypothetical protein
LKRLRRIAAGKDSHIAVGETGGFGRLTGGPGGRKEVPARRPVAGGRRRPVELGDWAAVR